ncbi:MAG: phosphoglycerate mutase family protein [Steroidobacteraceae bacterium]
MAESPTRPRRRPHAAPLLVPLIFVLAAGAGIFWLGTYASTTVVIVLRHAEATQDPQGDPELSPAGEARVSGLGEYVAGVLAGGKVDYLYAGDARRAQETAAPIANQFGLPINLLAPSDWDGFASRLKREHRGKTIVVVGYATTIPGVVSRLAGTNVALTDGDYDSIFVVVLPSPGSAKLFRLHYGPVAAGAKASAK